MRRHGRRALSVRPTTAWRRLFVNLGWALGIAVVVCAGLLAIGFGVHVGFFVLLAISIALVGWLVMSVVEPAPVLALAPDTGPPTSRRRQADWRTRKLEEICGGAQPRYAMTTAELRTVIARIAQARFGDATPLAVDTRRRPALSAYLAAETPPSLDRPRLHRILEELARP